MKVLGDESKHVYFIVAGLFSNSMSACKKAWDVSLVHKYMGLYFLCHTTLLNIIGILQKLHSIDVP